MSRALLAVVYLLTAPGAPVWAAASKFNAPNAGLPVPVRLSIPSPIPGDLGGAAESRGLSVTLPPVETPASAPATSPIPPETDIAPARHDSQAPVAVAEQPSLRDDVSGPHEAAPSAMAHLTETAQTADAMTLAPVSAEADSRRADFTNPWRAPVGSDAALGDLSSADSASHFYRLPPAPTKALRGLTQEPPAPSPAAASPKTNVPGALGFIGGTFFSQLAYGAFQVTLAMQIMEVSGSASKVGFVTGMAAALETAVTPLGGWLLKRLSPRAILTSSTILRVGALASLLLIPHFSSAGLTLAALEGAAAVEALARGTADSTRSVVPVTLTDGKKSALESINSNYMIADALGTIAGPSLVGALLLGLGAGAVHWVAPAALVAAVLLYRAVPGRRYIAEKLKASLAPGASPKPWADRWLRYAMLGTVVLTLYPLFRGLLPTIFAERVLHSPEQGSWLVALFGIGSLAAALLYKRLPAGMKANGGLRAGAVGAALLALTWLAGAFWPAAAGVLIFSVTNMAARLSLVSELQARTAKEHIGSVMSANRTLVNLTAMLLRFLVGLAFAAAAAAQGAFYFISAGIFVFALIQYWTARRLSKLGAGQ